MYMYLQNFNFGDTLVLYYAFDVTLNNDILINGIPRLP